MKNYVTRLLPIKTQIPVYNYDTYLATSMSNSYCQARDIVAVNSLNLKLKPEFMDYICL